MRKTDVSWQRELLQMRSNTCIRKDKNKEQGNYVEGLKIVTVFIKDSKHQEAPLNMNIVRSKQNTRNPVSCFSLSIYSYMHAIKMESDILVITSEQIAECQ